MKTAKLKKIRQISQNFSSFALGKLTKNNSGITVNETSPSKSLIRALQKEISPLSCELSDSEITRAMYATDAGNYRVLPQIVAFPKTQAELEKLVQAALKLKIPITPRGAGTSCAGNAIGKGLVIDYSAHLHRIIEINPEAAWAIVEPGVIQADLQKALAPYGLRFGPDPSTSNRCTIGGMVGNNACGPHATAYGKTSDNILELEIIDGHGHKVKLGSDQLQHREAYPELYRLAQKNLALVRTTFGTFSRQVSGYSCEHLLPEKGFNLARFLVGSEGTLGIITRIKVRLVPIAAAPVLVALGFPDMIAAARAVPAILPYKPLAVEGMDARLVEVVKDHKGPGSVPQLPPGAGWLLCEVGGAEMSEAAALAQAQLIAQAAGCKPEETIIYPPGEKASALWRIRADGAGLGGRTPKNERGETQQAWPGWEDAAVPPEALADYLQDFLDLMRDFQIDGLIYGHFGDGCVHVRLNLPLESAVQVGVSKDFLVAAAKLVAKYRGSISGEHGDGRARSELLPYMYSAETLELFRAVKQIFDPENLLNPGILVQADGLDEYLRRPQARDYPQDQQGFFYEKDFNQLTAAFHRCTGVGKCRANNFVTGGFMCPSYQATKQESEATRGRARVLQEATQEKIFFGLKDPRIWQALDLCLACKACSSDCPAGVDMAKWRSEYLFQRYQGKIRPLSHYTLGRLPVWLKLVNRVPLLPVVINLAMSQKLIRKIAFACTGIDTRRLMPKLAEEKLSRWVLAQGAISAKSQNKALGKPSSSVLDSSALKSSSYVVLWVDSFSQGLDQRGAKSILQLLQRLGLKVIIAQACCGLTWITTGQLETARKKLKVLLAELAPYAVNQIPIVTVEPSCTAVLRDDLGSLFPNDSRVPKLTQNLYTLAEYLNKFHADLPLQGLKGIEIVAQPHCHHYSVMGWENDRLLLEKMGVKVHELSGCCGLAGNFGMEKGKHYEISQKIAENSLLPALESFPQAVYLADGFSCRTQAEQLGKRYGLHLATLILQALEKSSQS